MTAAASSSIRSGTTRLTSRRCALIPHAGLLPQDQGARFARLGRRHRRHGASTVITNFDFDRLLADMRVKLHRYCARMTGSAVDGEDVVQDVLIKALGARSTIAGIENIEGWLFRIA